MTLTVTALTAAICALLLFFLGFRTVQQRLRTQTSFGAGSDEKLQMARGAHANLAENAPLFIIMLALLEMANANHWGLTIIAGIFLIARVSHAYGMHVHLASGNARFRQIGMIGTWLTTIALAVWILYLFVTVNL